MNAEENSDPSTAPLNWLSQHSFSAALWTAAFALAAPLLGLAVLSYLLGWILSPRPEDWTAWIPAIATIWGAILAAGGFVITVALFHMTARQAKAAATQAEAAATAAERSALESSFAADAIRGTIAQQRLDRQRQWEPLRNALQKTHVALAQVVTQARLDPTGAFLRTARPTERWWNEHNQVQWSNAEWLLPEARDQFRASQTDLKALDQTFDDLIGGGTRPSHLEHNLPAIATTAERIAQRLSVLSDSIDRASGFSVTNPATGTTGGATRGSA